MLRVVALHGKIDPDRTSGRTEMGLRITLENEAALFSIPREPDYALDSGVARWS